jgi:AcrR family transcriptional regulator
MIKTKEKLKITSEEFISKALLKLLNEKDYSEIDVSMICHKAGVSRVTFYRNFSSKDEVVSRYFKKIMSPFLEEASAIRKQKDLLSFFETYFSFLNNHIEVFEIIEKSKLGYLMLDYLNDAFAYLDKSTSLPNGNLTHKFIVGSLYNTALYYIKDKATENPTKLAQSLYDFCC